jgi:[ribosomal protein S18]-alanine N-acetyltransferase
MIREMTIQDLEHIMIIEQQAFTSPWSKQDFIYELTQNPFAHYLVLIEDKRLIAYIGLWFLGNHAQITNLAVHLDYLRKGHAQTLIQYALSLCYVQNLLNVNLEVRVSNFAAIALYEKLGFKKEAVRKDYYTDTHEDAYLMQRVLKEEKYENYRD